MKVTGQTLGTVGYLGALMTLPEEFCWSWGQMVQFNAEFVTKDNEVIHYERSKASLHASARNSLAANMRGDWLCMFDTDHVFEPALLYKLLRLMERYQTPVLSGIYRYKSPPYAPVLYLWDETVKAFSMLLEYDATQDVFQVDGAGGGCLLIHRSVFQRIEEELHEAPFEHIGKFGEDLSFFLRCRTLGIPVYATPQVESYHLMMHAVSEEDFIPEWQPGQDVAVKASREFSKVVAHV